MNEKKGMEKFSIGNNFPKKKPKTHKLKCWWKRDFRYRLFKFKLTNKNGSFPFSAFCSSFKKKKNFHPVFFSSWVHLEAPHVNQMFTI